LGLLYQRKNLRWRAPFVLASGPGRLISDAAIMQPGDKLMDASKRANVVRESRGMRRLGGALGRVALALGIVAFAPSCSVIVDTNADQCSEQEVASCPSGRTCSGGVCVEQPKCTTTSQCIASSGDFNICRKDPGQTGGRCVALKSKECQSIEGDYTSDEIFLIGSIHPTTAPPPDNEIGLSMENSIRLAVQEIDKTSNGLPASAGHTRPVVMIGCSDEGREEKSVIAAKHLVNNLGAQAIIGGAFSGIAIQTATEVTIPRGTLFISASATSPAITDLADKPGKASAGLVWRTVPSDLFQAEAIAKYVPQLEAATRVDLGLPEGAPVKLAILYKGDAYGGGLRDAVQAKLVLNGKSAATNDPANYQTFDYGNPDDEPGGLTKYGEAVDRIVQQGAHIVLLFGTGEAISEVFGKAELNWTVGTHRPRYVFSDSNYVAALANTVNAESDALQRADWRRRTTGVVPGPKDTDPLYKSFAISYASRFNQGAGTIFGAASAYDAVYLLFYSAATINDGILSGANLAQGMTKMSKADPPEALVNVGTGQINKTLSNLTSGKYKSIDYEGAFGPLKFDAATGEPAENVQIFCLKDANGQAKIGLSGQYYDANTGMITGAISPDCQ
jgi:branched-chain amino acid transport system substrate-binding protein